MCSKKNFCKICFEPVTKKNGIQCQGACQKWAHFDCLNYTPGKVKDIKAGVIKITCPCPDCARPKPKPELPTAPYACTNHQCPASKLPVCPSRERPSFHNIPTYRPQARQSGKKKTQWDCSAECNPESFSPSSSFINQPRRPQKYPNQSRGYSPPNLPSVTSSQSFSDTGCVSSGACCKKMKPVASETLVSFSPVDQRVIVSAIEGLCHTVGQLSDQLKDLVTKMTR